MNLDRIRDHDKPPLVRPIAAADIDAVAELCGQLGYATARDDVRHRLAAIIGRADHAVFVAEVAARVVGWLHVGERCQLQAPPGIEILGLVVDKSHRSGGVGTSLMREAEAWGRRRGRSLVRLRSNTVRDEAHRFYEAIGYRNTKTSYTFEKAMPNATPRARA